MWAYNGFLAYIRILIYTSYSISMETCSMLDFCFDLLLKFGREGKVSCNEYPTLTNCDKPHTDIQIMSKLTTHYLPSGSRISKPNHLKFSTIHKHGKRSLCLGVLALVLSLCESSLLWVFARWERVAEMRENTEMRERKKL